MPPFHARDRTLALRVSAEERAHIHQTARAAGFRTTSDYARHLTIDADCRRQSRADLARERCVHFLVLLVSATTDAEAVLPASAVETLAGLAALRDVYSALISDGGPPEPTRGAGIC